MSWFLGFFVSGTTWLLLNTIWPPPGLGEIDEKDVFGTFEPSVRMAGDSKTSLEQVDVANMKEA